MKMKNFINDFFKLKTITSKDIIINKDNTDSLHILKGQYCIGIWENIATTNNPRYNK